MQNENGINNEECEKINIDNNNGNKNVNRISNHKKNNDVNNNDVEQKDEKLSYLNGTNGSLYDELQSPTINSVEEECFGSESISSSISMSSLCYSLSLEETSRESMPNECQSDCDSTFTDSSLLTILSGNNNSNIDCNHQCTDIDCLDAANDRLFIFYFKFCFRYCLFHFYLSCSLFKKKIIFLLKINFL